MVGNLLMATSRDFKQSVIREALRERGCFEAPANMLWGGMFTAVPGGLPLTTRAAQSSAGPKVIAASVALTAEVLELQNTVYARPRRIAQRTTFAFSGNPKEWTPGTPMHCLSGPEARLAVVMAVHWDVGKPNALAAWMDAVTSAPVEIRMIPEGNLVAEHIVAQEIIDSCAQAVSLTVPRRALLVSAALQSADSDVAAVEKLYGLLPSKLQPLAQPLLLSLAFWPQSLRRIRGPS